MRRKRLPGNKLLKLEIRFRSEVFLSKFRSDHNNDDLIKLQQQQNGVYMLGSNNISGESSFVDLCLFYQRLPFLSVKISILMHDKLLQGEPLLL
ncbi:hypothetical protein ODZ84_00745 [Chryseobacterium fluminis]|uniref:hypothetical protein n=1 Tax=Chryseobacterium fluminis TaxID=2983606 RepID=UPI0022581B67|nr:hypothetical protein [Chryseobacterium sp. MMS21-Ot14]UZT98131.1 hypothetical protein ODZ84_00745 [Chryseobacterium sp. MMS21-Ot14]